MYDPEQRAALAAELAAAFRRAPWRADALAEAGAGALDRWPGWLDALAFQVTGSFRFSPESQDELAWWVEGFLAEYVPRAPEPSPPVIVRLVPPRPATAARRWPTARVDSPAELADRLELSPGQLAWLADVRGWERTAPRERLRNYRYRLVPRSGGRVGGVRVLEIPKARLKEIQRWILREILDAVAPHESAQGFTRGRSVLDHARRHSGQRAVLRLDVRDFFASVSAGRVYGIFRTLGYAPSVAHVLTGLCTNVVPQAVWRQVPQDPDRRLVGPRFWLGRQLATPHLPQGAPTSPALANLACFRLDRRVSALAEALGLVYSRYADDLTFSGPRLDANRLGRRVATIAAQEGFRLNEAKTSLRTSGRRQTVCGIVVNVRPNVTRAEYDRLRAILHNAARDGAAGAGVAGQEAHLRGRVAWVASLHPERGARLRLMFDSVDWG